MAAYKKEVNALRRRVMKALTSSIKKTQLPQGEPLKFQQSIKRILICRPNHRLGNQLLITPLLNEVQEVFPDAKVDLFLKGGAGNLIFPNFPNLGKMIQLPKKAFKELGKYLKVWWGLSSTHYDLVINSVSNSSSGRIATQVANGTYTLNGEINERIKATYPDYEHIAKFPVYSLRDALSQVGIDREHAPVSPLDMKLTTAELATGKKKLNELVDSSKPSICIFTFATGAKCYSNEWWETFYDTLKTTFPDHNIMELLPVENISSISFAAPSFYSKDVREMAAILANTEVFIGADSGVMHLAVASGVTTVGLFSVTTPNVYGPYGGKGNFAIDTNQGNYDSWIASIKEAMGSSEASHR